MIVSLLYYNVLCVLPATRSLPLCFPHFRFLSLTSAFFPDFIVSAFFPSVIVDAPFPSGPPTPLHSGSG